MRTVKIPVIAPENVFLACVTSFWKWIEKLHREILLLLRLDMGSKTMTRGLLTFQALHPATYSADPHLPHPRLGGSGVSL